MHARYGMGLTIRCSGVASVRSSWLGCRTLFPGFRCFGRRSQNRSDVADKFQKRHRATLHTLAGGQNPGTPVLPACAGSPKKCLQTWHVLSALDPRESERCISTKQCRSVSDQAWRRGHCSARFWSSRRLVAALLISSVGTPVGVRGTHVRTS